MGTEGPAMNELSVNLGEVLRSRYGLAVHTSTPLVGGYDTWAVNWRLYTDRGSYVLRIDRSAPPPTEGWPNSVITCAAAAGVPCQPPMPALDGARAAVIDGATVTLRPFVEGGLLNRDDARQVAAAGATLGLLHTALRGATNDRATPSPWAAQFWPGDRDPPALCDPALDAWHESFVSGVARFAEGAVHGDYWADNLLWHADQIAAVIDWSEARVDALARELAWATWEFGHDQTSPRLDADRARTFLDGYREVAGPWEPGLAAALIPLMRVELRLHARYTLADPGDTEYSTWLQHAFARLGGYSAATLLDG